MEAVFQDCIREVKAEGRTVLLSSHILAEVEALCDRVSIIRAGRTATERHPAGAARHDPHVDHGRTVRRPADGLAGLPGVHGLEVDGTRVRFDVDTAHLDDAVRRLGELGVRSLVSHPPTLEELFLRHYGDELAHETGARGPPRATSTVIATGASLTGLAPLTRFAVRRDRVRIVVWVASIVLARRGRRSRASRACTRTRPISTRPRSASQGQRGRDRVQRPGRRVSTPSAGRSRSRPAPSGWSSWA